MEPQTHTTSSHHRAFAQVVTSARGGRSPPQGCLPDFPYLHPHQHTPHLLSGLTYPSSGILSGAAVLHLLWDCCLSPKPDYKPADRDYVCEHPNTFIVPYSVIMANHSSYHHFSLPHGKMLATLIHYCPSWRRRGGNRCHVSSSIEEGWGWGVQSVNCPC